MIEIFECAEILKKILLEKNLDMVVNELEIVPIVQVQALLMKQNKIEQQESQNTGKSKIWKILIPCFILGFTLIHILIVLVVGFGIGYFWPQY